MPLVYHHKTQVNMQMSLSKLQGHYVIRHNPESEKTELVFSAIYSTDTTDNTAGKDTQLTHL